MDKKKPKIALIYTGGTIGMMKDPESGSLKPFNFDKLLKRIPEIKLLSCDITTLTLFDPIDSSNMHPWYWEQMAKMIAETYEDYDGYVLLHGSDTMSYTASALSFMLENLDKPVIVTGSQLPIGDLRTDAKENLITAIQMASLQHYGKPLIREVGLYFEYKLYRGNRTTKISAEHFEAFDSPNYPPLAESGVNLEVNKNLLFRAGKGNLRVHPKFETNIALVKLFPGISNSFLEPIFNSASIKGIIVETYGAGNMPTDKWLLQLLSETVKRGIPIINVTQCSGGKVVMGQYETSEHLRRIGIISGWDITTEAAVTKLMYLLGQGLDIKHLKKQFEISLRGEIS
ncbi:MAG: asparaginase [Flavobacteriaceae bacterium]|nr:asparaginase [Flavobacteriaceae bacterium]